MWYCTIATTFRNRGCNLIAPDEQVKHFYTLSTKIEDRQSNSKFKSKCRIVVQNQMPSQSSDFSLVSKVTFQCGIGNATTFHVSNTAEM